MVNSACDEKFKILLTATPIAYNYSPIEGKEAMEVKLNTFDELTPWKLTNTRERGIEVTMSGSRKRSLVPLVRRVHV